MKKIILLTFFCYIVAGSLYAQQFLFKTGVITGQGIQAGRLSTAFGVGVQFQHSIKHTPFEVVTTAETNINGRETHPYQLKFGSTVTNIDADYMSTISKITAGISYLPLKQKIVTPFVSLQAGALWYNTKVLINDPHNEDGCRPLEGKSVKFSLLPIGQLESGLRFYLSKKRKTDGPFIQGGVGYTAGTRGTYIKLMSEHEISTTPNNGKSVDYTAKFESAEGEVHEHVLGKIYRTNTNQLFYSVGFGITL